MRSVASRVADSNFLVLPSSLLVSAATGTCNGMEGVLTIAIGAWCVGLNTFRLIVEELQVDMGTRKFVINCIYNFEHLNSQLLQVSFSENK